MHATWRIKEPEEFRAPIPVEIALAIAVVLFATGDILAAALVVSSHHLLLRPFEFMQCLRSEIAIFPIHARKRYSKPIGIFGISRPKMGRRAVGRQQYVLIEDSMVAALLRWLLRGISAQRLRSRLWPFSEADFRKRWDRACAMLGLGFLRLTPGGLRGGGACHHFLTFQNVPAVRRRGRWAHEDTLEHYLQEAAYYTASLRLPDTLRQRIEFFAALAESLFVDPGTPAPPLTELVAGQGASQTTPPNISHLSS